MALTPGTRLGSYEIADQIGKGGMGEVYRARDSRLGREVAIKVLPSEFARDEERLARLEREARMLAALNHPNIAAIYGLEEAGEERARFLVLELVEGDTLADRLEHGALRVKESLEAALQIAQALEAAHEKGVIHRDLKPANIKITPDGRVKVLDFGLAKALSGERADLNLSNSPTLSMAATQQGMILGTAAYMSPEQASGETADHRSDIWAFGVVLFEMLSGGQLFTGKTASHIMGAVLERAPDWNRLPANLHPVVRELLERCLEKEAKNRRQAIGDVRFDLQKVLAEPGSGTVEPLAEPVRTAPQSRLPWIAAIALVGLLAAAGAWFLKPPQSSDVVRLEHSFPEGVQAGSAGAIAISPEGRRIAYGTSGGLYLLSVDQFEARLVPGTEGVQVPSVMFSPDGEWLAYPSPVEQSLLKIPVTGGAPVVIADLLGMTMTSGTWGEDNRIVLATAAPAGIMEVSGDGGTPESLFDGAGSAVVGYLSPQKLPDGESILFTLAGGPNRIQVALLTPGSEEPRVLFPGAGARYLPTGHIVYFLDGALYAQRFDPDALETVGGPVPMVEDVATPVGFKISDSGTLAWFPGTGTLAAFQRSLVWVDREGREEPITAEPRGYEYLRISHDGRRVAVDEANQGGDIRVWNFASENGVRLTTGDESELYPVWSQDDGRIAFAIAGGESGVLYSKASNNTGAVDVLTRGLGSGIQGVTPYFFTPDDEAIVFREQAHPSTRDNIGMVALDGDSEPAWLLASEFEERNAELSPDGGWMAYQSNESGRFEIYVRPFPNVDDGLWTISTAGGTKPVWGPNGDELIYLEPGDRQRLMVVEVETGAEFGHGLPEVLIDPWPYDLGREGRTYDIAPDGSRFLTTKAVDTGPDTEGEPAGPSVRVVLNWTRELLERVPVN